MSNHNISFSIQNKCWENLCVWGIKQKYKMLLFLNMSTFIYGCDRYFLKCTEVPNFDCFAKNIFNFCFCVCWLSFKHNLLPFRSSSWSSFALSYRHWSTGLKYLHDMDKVSFITKHKLNLYWSKQTIYV